MDSIIDFLEEWKNAVRHREKEAYQEYYIIDITGIFITINTEQEVSPMREDTIMSISFKREVVVHLFIGELSMHKKGSVGIRHKKWYYSKSPVNEDFMCISGESGSPLRFSGSRPEKEVLEHVRNSFWYLKNK